jgi:heptosyltransferase-2
VGPRIVIVDPAFLGDVVFDGPLVRAIKARAPEAVVGMVVRPPADAIARRMVGVDRVHRFDKYGSDRGWRGLARVARELSAEGYAQALIPHPSIRSVLLAVRAGIPRRIGWARAPAGWLLADRRPARPDQSHVDRRLALLDPPGGDPELVGTLRAEPRPASGRVRVGLLLGSAWATKAWPFERFAELAERIDPDRVELVLLGGDSDRARRDELQAATRRPFVDAVGGSIEALIDTIASCRVVIGGDTGPLHIARALGVPVVALFGPTPPEAHRFAGTDRVLWVDLPCRPCHPHGHQRCPLGHHRCLRDLDAARVERATWELLAAP